MSTSIQPEDTILRSPVYRKFLKTNFSSIPNSVIAEAISTDDVENAKRSGLVDVSTIARTGFRGKNAEKHLTKLGYPIPEKPNKVKTCENGELILRLSMNEFWVIGSLKDQGFSINELITKSTPSEGCYPLYCQNSHAWFIMSGIHLSEAMSKVCGVDLREVNFPEGSIAQTSIARVNAIIVHHTINGESVFSILSDSASAEYLWESLLDATSEFSGKVVGYKSLL